MDKYKDIETNITKRWEDGVEHHPKSVELIKHLMEIDFNFCNDYFDFKVGGDGDNGETLMYELDIFFEMKSKTKQYLYKIVEPGKSDRYYNSKVVFDKWHKHHRSGCVAYRLSFSKWAKV